MFEIIDFLLLRFLCFEMCFSVRDPQRTPGTASNTSVCEPCASYVILVGIPRAQKGYGSPSLLGMATGTPVHYIWSKVRGQAWVGIAMVVAAGHTAHDIYTPFAGPFVVEDNIQSSEDGSGLHSPTFMDSEPTDCKSYLLSLLAPRVINLSLKKSAPRQTISTSTTSPAF